MVSATESFNIAFVVDDIAHTFELDSITKGIVGGSGFLGESITRCTCGFANLRCCYPQRAGIWYNTTPER